MGIQGFAPPRATDEHIIRRLGWAVVLQVGRNSSKEDQTLLHEQSTIVHDRVAGGAQLKEQIATFIRNHAPGD